MTILLAGNSVIPMQIAAIGRIADAEGNLSDIDSVSAEVALTHDEHSEAAVFSLLSYFALPLETDSQTALPQGELIDIAEQHTAAATLATEIPVALPIDLSEPDTAVSVDELAILPMSLQREPLTGLTGLPPVVATVDSTLSPRGSVVTGISPALHYAVTSAAIPGQKTASSPVFAADNPKLPVAAALVPVIQSKPLPEGLSLQRFLHLQPTLATSGVVNSLVTGGDQPMPVLALPQWRGELSGTPTNWGTNLLALLTDKVVLQLGQQVQRAQIRLDPPQLGNIELRISVEGEKTSIQLFASQPQVREVMQQTLELLRLNLVQQLGENNMVDVQLGEQSQQQQPFFADESGITAQQELVEADSQYQENRSHSSGWVNRLV